MGKKTSRIQNDIEQTRERMTELVDELTAKLDVRSFAKRHALLLGSAAAGVGLAIWIFIRRITGTSGGDSDSTE